MCVRQIPSPATRGGVLQVVTLATIGLLSMSSAAQAPKEPILLLPAGQVVPLPPAGTASEMPLPAYDLDEDRRNEWSKAEFPHLGECRWMPVAWGGKPTLGQGTAAERTAIQRTLEKAIAFLKTAPVGNPPIGICPWVVSAGSDGALDQGYALTSSFLVANWAAKTLSRSTPGGRIVRGELLHLGFTFNVMPGSRISPTYSSPFQLMDAQGEFYPEGQPGALFQGFPAYLNGDEGYLVVPLHNRPLFRPMLLGRTIRWQLAQFDKELVQLRAISNNAKLNYDRYFSPTAQAEEDRIIVRRIENERARTPEAEARVRASRAAEVQQQTAALRAQWDVADNPGHRLNIATRLRAEAEARLANLSADEARGAACLVTPEQSTFTPGVAAAGEAACAFNLVETNPDYYDRTLPRTALQILTISRFSSFPPVGGLPGERRRYTWANRHMLWGLDWQKFRRDVLGATTPFDIATVTPYAGTPRALPPGDVAIPRETVESPDSPPVAPPSAGALAAPPGTFRTRGPISTEKPTVETLQPVYATNQLVEVRFSGMSGIQRDWMAIAPSGAPIEQYQEWTYFEGKTSGTYRFNRRLPPGRYEIRAFDEGSAGRKGVKASAEFEVR